MSDISYLTLGWQVTPKLEPKYWLNPEAKPGSQDETDLVRIPAATISSHTAIIAQSGSGKSFFLGRLIEELIVNTRARCLILDPNADFRKVHEVEGTKLWENAKYNTLLGRGKLPHEANQEEFKSLWAKLSIRIKTGGKMRGAFYEQLKLLWPSLSVEFLAEDLDPMLRSDLYHCHAFVQALASLLQWKSLFTKQPLDLIDEAEKLLQLARKLPKDSREGVLEKEIGIGQQVVPLAESFFFLGTFLGWPKMTKESIKNAIERACTALEYVSPTVERFYFGKAREYQAAGIIDTEMKSAQLPISSTDSRLTVVDLPSLASKPTRLLAVNAMLATEWSKSRLAWTRALEGSAEDDYRVPTFIVLDEAHNLIPAEPTGKPESTLREQFRTIAAEGRKYGLFLIIVSQRPDKLDPLILSECENKAIMKIGSHSVLDATRNLLNLDDVPPKLLEKCLDFETGRVLLVGNWVQQGPLAMFCAARRTKEGGRSLMAENWAIRPKRVKPRTRYRRLRPPR